VFVRITHLFISYFYFQQKGSHHAATTINEFDRVGLDDSKDRMVLGKWEGVRRCVNAYFGIDDVGDDDDDDPQRRRQDTSTDDGKLMSRSEMIKLKREFRLQKKNKRIPMMMTGDHDDKGSC